MRSLARLLKGNTLRAQLVKAASGTAALKVTYTVVMLLIGVILARALGPEHYGVFTYALSIVTVLGIPTKAGLQALVLRETAKYHAKKQWSKLKGLLSLSNTFVTGFSLIVAIGAAIYIWTQLGDEESFQHQTMLWALPLLPLVAFGNLRGATLRGFRRIVWGQLPEAVIVPVTLLALLTLALLLQVQLTPVMAMQFQVLASAVAFAIGAMLLWRIMPREVKDSQNSYETKVWAVSLGPLTLFAGLKMVDTQLATVALGLLGSARDVGLFRVAVQGGNLVALGLIIVNIVLAPQVAKLHAEGQMERLQRIILRSTRAIMGISIPAFVILCFWGKQIINFVFGQQYEDASLALVIMCAGQIVNASVGSVAIVLNMTGNERRTIGGIVIGLILNLVLSVTLIPKYGNVGAAIAYATSTAVWNIMLARQTYKFTGLKTFFLSRPPS